ncbi:MAG: hypothetical protein Q4D38_14530, partial [Planctomycetia bacterium]|nr:hypothetical protein [Planctomycetia bacterium]
MKKTLTLLFSCLACTLVLLAGCCPPEEPCTTCEKEDSPAVVSVPAEGTTEEAAPATEAPAEEAPAEEAAPAAEAPAE